MRLLVIFILSVSWLISQDIQVGEVSKANINSILIFSSQDGLNSGVYHFKKRSITLNTYHLPLKYHLSSQTNWNYFIEGDVSFSRAYVSAHTLEPLSTQLANDSSIDTYIGGIGGGIRYTFGYGLSSSFGFEVLYSKAGVKLGQANVGDTIKNFFDHNFNDNLTYKFETSLDYFYILDDYKIFADLSYKIYETKTSFSFDELSDFHSESSVIGFSTGFETPKLASIDINYLTLEGKIYENFLFGTVNNVSAVNRYTSLSGTLYWYVPNKYDYIERFFLDLSSAQSEALEGYNIGVGFSVQF